MDLTWKEVKNKQVFVESDYTTTKMKKLLESLREDFVKGKNKDWTLIIVDDLMSEYNSKKSSVFEYLAANGRHFLVDYIFTSQKYNKMTPTMRLNSTTKMFFRITNNKEMTTINEENSQRDLKNDTIVDMIDNFTKDHYNFFLMKDGLEMNYFTGKGLEVDELEVN